MRRIKAILEYEGTDFYGWQRQAGAPSIQEAVESALGRLFRKPVRVTAAGRTDAGVHALGQVISFLTDSNIPLRGILRGGNSFLPETIRLVRVEDVPLSFNPRKDAILRWYRYRALNRSSSPALGRALLSHIPYKLDDRLLSEVCSLFSGVHDFAAFRSADCTARRTRLNLETFHFQRRDDLIIFDLRCRSFLQNMARILVGAAVEAARGKIPLSLLQEILATGQRDPRIPTASACGLVLMKVYYPAEIIEEIRGQNDIPGGEIQAPFDGSSA